MLRRIIGYHAHEANFLGSAQDLSVGRGDATWSKGAVADRLAGQVPFRVRFLAWCIKCVGWATSLIGGKFYYPINSRLSRLARRGETIEIEIGAGSQFAFRLADPYWNRLLSPQFSYETELLAVFEAIGAEDFVFLDVGANYGFWSVLVSSPAFGAHRAVAVEPVSATFRMLAAIATRNADRFTCVHAAATSSGEGTVTIRTDPNHISNVGASISAEAPSQSLSGGEDTPATSVDVLVQNHCPDAATIVLKLDVEGAEIDALEGAADTLRRDVLIIYEDHGADPACSVSHAVLARGLDVYFFDGARFRNMTDVAQIKAVKRRASRGYNFFAFKRRSALHRAFLHRVAQSPDRSTPTAA